MDDDIQLMLRAKDGDHQAFTEVRRKYLPSIRRFLAYLGCPEGLLEDTIQEVFSRVWDKRQEYQPTCTVLSFLRGFARKIWYAQCRRLKRQTIAYQRFSLISNPLKHSSEPGAILERRELTDAIKQFKSKLPDKQRQAVDLVFELGLSYTEAARQSGCSENALYQRLYQAKGQLAEMLLRKFQMP